MRDTLNQYETTAEIAFKQCITDHIPPEQWLSVVIKALDPADDDALYTLLSVGHVLSWGSREHALRHIARRKSPVVLVAVAIYYLLGHVTVESDTIAEWLPADAATLVEWVIHHRQGTQNADT